MADTIEQARGYMSRDKESVVQAFRILRDRLLDSELMNPPNDLRDYDSKRRDIIRELERVQAYLRDVIG